MISTAPAKAQSPPSGEHRVTLHGLNWQGYQQILQALPQTRAARLAYDRGMLEITVLLEEHEFAIASYLPTSLVKDGCGVGCSVLWFVWR